MAASLMPDGWDLLRIRRLSGDADAMTHHDLVQLLLQITADESESDEALRAFGSLLDRVTSTLELTEWDLRDMLEPAWDAYCG